MLSIRVDSLRAPGKFEGIKSAEVRACGSADCDRPPIITPRADIQEGLSLFRTTAFRTTHFTDASAQRTPALPHLRTPAPPTSRTSALPHFRTPALPHLHPPALPHFRT